MALAGNHDGEADLSRREIMDLDIKIGGNLTLSQQGPRCASPWDPGSANHVRMLRRLMQPGPLGWDARKRAAGFEGAAALAATAAAAAGDQGLHC